MRRAALHAAPRSLRGVYLWPGIVVEQDCGITHIIACIVVFVVVLLHTQIWRKQSFMHL